MSSMTYKQLNKSIYDLHKQVTANGTLDGISEKDRKELYGKVTALAKVIRPPGKRGFSGELTEFGISRTALAMNLGGAGWSAHDVDALMRRVMGYDTFVYAKAYTYKGKKKGTCDLSKKQLSELKDRLKKWRESRKEAKKAKKATAAV